MKRLRRCVRRGRFGRHRWAALGIAFIVLAAIAGWFVYPQSSAFQSKESAVNVENFTQSGSDNLALMAQSVTPTASSQQVVYPYSVVPGGVRSPEELRKASAKDRLVAAHYAGFNYREARVVPVTEPKLVYVSYRIKDKIYWTKKKLPLHKGEYVLTDGKITARTRCANQVSEVAMPQISPQEPPAFLFEDPFGQGNGTAIQAPSNFESALLTRPGLEGLGGGGPSNSASGLYAPGTGGYYPGILPPGIPGGGGPHKPPTPPPPGPPPPPPGPPPVVVPEPGTMLLISSGIAGLYWRYRKSGGKR